MMSPESSQTKKYMAGILMSLLHGNLHKLSTENFQNLLNYYATGILTLQIESSLLSDLTKHMDTSQELLSLN